MEHAALAEGPEANLEAACPAGERGLGDPRGVALEDPGEADPPGLEVEQPLDRLTEEGLAGAVREAQAPRAVEGEHGDVDLRHHPLQERRRLQGAEPLLAQGLGERVQLAQGVAERPVVAAGAGAEGEVALAQRAEEVRDRLEGARDRLPGREPEEQPPARGDEAERPPRPALEAGEPREEHERDRQRQRARAEGEEGDAAVVGQEPPARPPHRSWRWSRR
ncbi:MAG: hypothetical protein U0599_25215 [Vicinamibacteria bacterium]